VFLLVPATMHRIRTSGKRVKYYVVQPPAGQRSEDLYEIAVKTLGDGSVAATIFRQLNHSPAGP
jgi:hypothetical protein